MVKFNATTLDVFVYTLPEGWKYNDNLVRTTYDQFWENFPVFLKKGLLKVFFPELFFSGYSSSSIPVTLQHLDPNQWEFEVNLDELHLTGSCDWQDLGDTYAVWLDYYPPQSFELSQTLQSFKEIVRKSILLPLKKYLVSQRIADLYLSETWIISGCLKTENSINIDEFIGKIYQELIGDQWQQKNSVKLLNATVIELWRGSQNWEDFESNSHLIIVIYPDASTMEKAIEAGLYEAWLYLLACRHQIVCAYQKYLNLKKQLNFQMQQFIIPAKTPNTMTIKELQENLIFNEQSLKQHSECLDFLERQKQLIQNNWLNYETFFQKIQENPEWNVKNSHLLEEFSEIVTEQYIIHITADTTKLSEGVEIVKNRTNTLRAMLNMRQSDRQRQKKHRMVIVGVGLLTTGIVFSTQKTYRQTLQSSPPFKTFVSSGRLSVTDSTTLMSVSLSLMIGAIASLLTAAIFLWRSHRFSQKGDRSS